MAGRYEVRFDNGRTETCRDRDLTVVRYAPRLHHGAAPRFVGAGVARPAP